MVELVEMYKKEITCDSQLVAKKFGYKHSELTKTINKLIVDISNLRGGGNYPYFEETKREYRGNNFTAFIMGREFFSLLCMRLKGKKALEWQMNFNSAFYEMESALIKANANSNDNEWLKVRSQSKALRLQQTDVIKDFVEYATLQGSKSAKFYYKHVTNATYKALNLIQHKKPKLKDTLDCMELSQLMVAENVAKLSIKRHMENNEHYKTIFVLVKQDLEKLSSTLMIEQN
jgi:Rha family phage regulatory protein